jgi:predicted dinucleotide-binding enzyme
MKIGIIGTGNIGGTLAHKLRTAGHDVCVANSRGVEGVKAFANEIGATPVDTRGAVEGVDLVVISIPFPVVAELPKDLFETIGQDVPVIDTGNYYPGLRDPQIPEIDAGMPHSAWVSKQIGRPDQGIQQHPGPLLRPAQSSGRDAPPPSHRRCGR